MYTDVYIYIYMNCRYYNTYIYIYIYIHIMFKLLFSSSKGSARPWTRNRGILTRNTAPESFLKTPSGLPFPEPGNRTVETYHEEEAPHTTFWGLSPLPRIWANPKHKFLVVLIIFCYFSYVVKRRRRFYDDVYYYHYYYYYYYYDHYYYCRRCSWTSNSHAKHMLLLSLLL